ncbi:GGDEF domain-containing protein [Vibrio sp. SNU_ST1]|uniref:GGDEF domain-containing protein n=1 Tax=Vibrio sp. SNU_ST1 TaxID=3064001 RepID=UPI00272D682C|nr:GGDEF domain-containing protein [Vibrio sp. SNU_ST1]WKY57945.1 GGDEF domain-containing protein [Vibrio sp. SNU_ST1]
MLDMKREEWLSTLIRELPDRHLLLDTTGRIVENFDNPIHHTVAELLPPAVEKQLLEAVKKAHSNRETQYIHYSLAPCQQLQLSIEQLFAQGEGNVDSDYRYFESTLKPLYISPEKQYILWQERDITKTHQRESELKRLAEIDELTGILNRRAFLLGLEKEFSQSPKQSLTCLMIDIDHFKEINDQVGHLSGDEVIVQVASLCQQSIGSNGYIGRLGGEEFGVILTHTSAIEAYYVAETIRKVIESTPCTVDGHIIYPTVSIGVAEYTPHLKTIKELLAQADRAMYSSKQTGRNQVTLYHNNLPTLKIDAQLRAKILQAS